MTQEKFRQCLILILRGFGYLAASIARENSIRTDEAVRCFDAADSIQRDL